MGEKIKTDILSRMAVVICAVFFMAAGMIINVDSVAAEDPEWTISPASQIGGWRNDMDVAGNYAYLTEGYSLRVLDLTGDSPEIVGSVFLGGEPSRIFFKDNHVYAIAQGQGNNFFCIVDVSAPSNPILLGSCEVSWGNFCVYGNYAYIAASRSEKVLQIVDVSNKTAPQVVGTPAFFPTCIAAANGKLYGVGAEEDTYKFWVYDLSAPTAPQEEGCYSPAYSGESLFVEGDRAYVACGYSGMQIFDISTPTSPGKLASYNLQGLDAKDIFVNSNLAYIAGGNNGLKIFDVNDYNNIEEKGTVTGINAWKVSVAFPYAYVMAFSDEPLVKIDVSNPANPEKEGGFESPRWADTIVTDGQWLFMLSEKLWIYNLSDPKNPSLSATYDQWPDMVNLFVDGNVLYATRDKQMLLLNVSDPENISELSTTYQAQDNISRIFVSGGYAYLLLNPYGAGVEIVNVSNPGTPVKVEDASLSFTGSWWELFVGNGAACVAGWNWEGEAGNSNKIYWVKLFDVSSPASPAERGYISLDGKYPSVWAMGNTLFVSSEAGESPYTPYLQAFDISDLSNPQAAGQINPEKVANDLQVVELGGGLPLILTASPGGSVHTYSYSTDTKTFTPGESCYSPYSYQLTAASSPSSSADYVVVTNDCSYGIYTQEIVGGGEVEPVLTLSPGPQNPAPETEAYSVETEIGYKLTEESFTRLAAAGVPAGIRASLQELKNKEYTSDATFLSAILTQLGANDTALYKDRIFEHAMTIWAEDVPIIHIILSANDVDDWLVTSLAFQSSGLGDEKEDVVEVRLYLNSINGKLLGTTTYSADDGIVSFSMSEIIPRSNSKSFILVYDFDAEKACPCNNYQSFINMGQVAALPINDPNFVKLPPIPEGVTGGPTKIKKGTLTKVDGDQQYGETEQPLPKPFKVKMTYEDPECVKHVDFTMGTEAASFGAKFSNSQTSSRVNVDAYNEARETLTLGRERGMKHPYYIQVTPDHNGAECLYSESAVFTSWGAGVDLATSAQHDGTGDGDKNFSTFISAIQAENKFTVEIDMAPEDFAEVEEVIFNLGGTVKQGNMVTQNKKYEAVFDMAAFETPQTLLITVKMKKDGQDIEEQEEYQVKSLKLPSWVSAVNAICHEESYSQEFDSEEEKYKFEFNYPTNFAWSDYVPSSVGLLGGLENDLDIEFNASAWYGINEISNFGATINGTPTILGQEFDVEGGLNGTFDPDFAFQRGNGALKASTSFDLPEKGYSKTFIVYCVPITVAVDLGGNVEIFVNGSAVLNRDLEFEKITVAPGTTVTGNITVSLSAVLGLAKLAATGSPAATVEIEITYITASGTTTTWRGEIVVPLKVVGSIFWGMGSAELWAGELGPWTFGSSGGRSPSAFRPLQAEEGPASPRFISTSSMAMDTSGKRMVVWIGDTASDSEPPNPDVYYRYYDGTDWSSSDPIIGGSSPNLEWETDPAVVFMSGGTALAAWTTNDKEPDPDDPIQNDNLNDILAAQDIAFSVWNGTFWSAPARIIDDAEADGTVRLVYDASNNKVMAVWMHDANTDNDVETRTEWKLLYAIYDPYAGTWSAPQDVPTTSQGNADYMPALAVDGSGNALVLWVKDDDGVFHQELGETIDGTNVDLTNEDCNIYWSKWNGASWDAPAVLTGNNPATELFPAVTFAPDDKALAVWVEKEGTTERLLYRIFDLGQGTWSAPGEIFESPHFIEEPKVVVDSSGKATVIWRGGSSRGSDLFSSWATMANLIWSEPEQITHDDMVDWNISVALDSDGKVTTCWSKYDTSSGDENSGSGFSDGVNMAQTNPGSAAITGTYSDQGIDTDSDGFFDLLAVSVNVNVVKPGDYGMLAELYGTGKIAEAETSAISLAAGTHTFVLNFPGGIISDIGKDGPYYLKNLVVLDMNDSVVETAFEAAPYTTTGPYTADQFAGSPLSVDKSEYEGMTDKAVITVVDMDENTDPGTKQIIAARVVSTHDLTGIAVSLIETGNDTGIFTGEVGFNPVGSNQATGQIKVVDHCLIQVIYDDENPSYHWITSATWLSLASAGDLNADGEVDLADVIIALKVISGMDPGVDLSDYTSSESWVDGDEKVSMAEAIYILQKIADLR